MADRLKLLFSWRSAILDSTLGSTTKLVALTLATYMSERGDSAFPGAMRLAHDSSLSERAVRQHLTILVDAGWLDLVRRGGVVRGKHLGNEYRAAIPDPTLPLHDLQGAGDAPMQEMHPTPASDDRDPCTRITPIHQEHSKNTDTRAKPFEEDFAAWYAGYPRKIDRKQALAAYTARRRQGITHEQLTQARDAYARSVEGDDLRYVKYPATFLAKDGPWTEWEHGPPAGALTRPARPPNPEPVTGQDGARFYPGTGWITDPS